MVLASHPDRLPREGPDVDGDNLAVIAIDPLEFDDGRRAAPVADGLFEGLGDLRRRSGG